MKIRVNTPLGKIALVARKMPNGRIQWQQAPDLSKRVLSTKQHDHETRFQKAALYAREAARAFPIYAELAAKSPDRNAYNIALLDWFHPPEIPDVDLSRWNRDKGKTIRVKAWDEVQVTKVTVTIRNEKGELLKQGPAIKGRVWWTYTTQVAARRTSRRRICRGTLRK